MLGLDGLDAGGSTMSCCHQARSDHANKVCRVRGAQICPEDADVYL